MATSGFLTVPNERNSESTLGSLGRCLCEGLLGMKKGYCSFSSVELCVEKCELLLLYTVIDYMGWGVSKDLARLLLMLLVES